MIDFNLTLTDLNKASHTSFIYELARGLFVYLFNAKIEFVISTKEVRAVVRSYIIHITSPWNGSSQT